MIDHIATAIDKAIAFNVEGDVRAHEMTLEERRMIAREVLKAMREPTPAMVDAFVSRALQVKLGGDYTWSDYARDQWHQMIDAALAEEQST